MLKRIPISCYPDEETYDSTMQYFKERYERMCDHGIEPERAVIATIGVYFMEDFDEEGMDKLVMLISGMLWSIEHHALPDNDPTSLAYNAWYALLDFATGKYDELFTKEDLPKIKKDVQFLMDYFDQHPALKGDNSH
ncbi:MAG: hypothetical protein IJT07_02585 [Oscillospiraceae bacterium]|nr:hypothetical protein [Oscillospiraceae bacterium]